MAQPLERITHGAEKNATHSIIWLHGLGADGNDFVPILPQLELRPTTRITFPHAPVRPITLNYGMPMRGWYDIKDLSFEQRDEDLAGIEASAAQILAIARRRTGALPRPAPPLRGNPGAFHLSCRPRPHPARRLRPLPAHPANARHPRPHRPLHRRQTELQPPEKQRLRARMERVPDAAPSHLGTTRRHRRLAARPRILSA